MSSERLLEGLKAKVWQPKQDTFLAASTTGNMVLGPITSDKNCRVTSNITIASLIDLSSSSPRYMMPSSAPESALRLENMKIWRTDSHHGSQRCSLSGITNRSILVSAVCGIRKVFSRLMMSVLFEGRMQPVRTP